MRTHYRPQGTNGQIGETLLWTLSAWDRFHRCCSQLLDHSSHSQLDADPTIKELDKAIEALSNGNAAMVSHPRWSSPQVCPPWASLRPCWKKGAVPQDMNDVTIRLCKNKGDLSDCNSYRGIYLVSIVGLARVLLTTQTTSTGWPPRIPPGFQCCFSGSGDPPLTCLPYPHER